MLSFVNTKNRREFLRLGSWGLGGLTLAKSLEAAEGAKTKPILRDKSVVFLFMHGGPSQFETFDPKMDAPAEIRSTTGEIPTALPGVTFGSSLPRLAGLADRLSIVRSFTTGNGRHDIKPIVGKATDGASLGSIYARIAGSTHPANGMPRNVALYPRAVDSNAQPANMKFGEFGSTGSLGSAFAPFVPGGSGDLQRNMELALSQTRLGDRRSLLRGLDRLRRASDETGALGGVDRFREQAFETILGGVADAFDLTREDDATVRRYDTEPLVKPDAISRQWNNYNNYVDNARSLGKLMLLARRLCEAGAGFVTVTTNFVWDMHSDRNNAGVEEGMGYMGPPFDHAVSAFLEDVAARGLSDRILLVCCGEMGRTPKINGRGGRDHWGGLAPLMLAGGGLNMGQVIGESTRDGGAPLSNRCEIPNLVSTIFHTMFDVGELRLKPDVPRDVMRMIEAGRPIPGLL